MRTVQGQSALGICLLSLSLFFSDSWKGPGFVGSDRWNETVKDVWLSASPATHYKKGVRPESRRLSSWKEARDNFVSSQRAPLRSLEVPRQCY